MKVPATKRSAVLAVTIALILWYAATSLKIIQLHYLHLVDNDPLIAPMNVRSVTDTQFTLEDGRTFDLVWCSEPLEKIMKESGYRVDLDIDDAQGVIAVYAKEPQFVCGMSWSGLIEIPLIPDYVSRNRRIEIGRVVSRRSHPNN